MDLVNYLDKLNWQSIVGMFAICWYFTHDIKLSLKKLDENIQEQGRRIDAQGARTDKLYEIYCESRKEIDQKFYDMLKERFK